MLVFGFCVVLFVANVRCAILNQTCPDVSPRALDLKELDGTWYLSEAASEIQLEGECAVVTFKHTAVNATGISINWISNRTATYYNGSAVLITDTSHNVTSHILQVTFLDEVIEKYSFLDVEYGHYAVVFSCTGNRDGSSTYELWKLSRRPHIKADDAAKIRDAIKKYGLENTEFVSFNNTEECCKTNEGTSINPTSLVMTSAMAMTIFRRLY